MQTLCYFYIFIIILFKNLEGASDVEKEQQQQQEQQEPRHLSRKLNPTEALATAVNCQRQVDAHWPDKLPENENAYMENEQPRTRHHQVKRRRRRETPTHFVVRLPVERPYNRVRRHPRHRAPRKRRKRKRINPSIANDIIPSGEIEIDEELEDENELVDNNVGQANNASAGKSNQNKSQLVFTILSSILALILAGLLLAYLYRRSRNKNECDPFFCSPDMGDNFEEIDRCTCCSERMVDHSSPHHISRPPTRRNSPPPPPAPPPRKMKRTTTTTKTKRVKKPIPPPPPPRLSEAELRLIQSRIACILRNDCAACQCCKCDAAADIEQPKRSKFKLFRKKKKKIGLCNDARCGENKIKCLTNLWSNYNSDTASSRVGAGRHNVHEPLLPNPCARSARGGRERMNLRIKE